MVYDGINVGDEGEVAVPDGSQPLTCLDEMARFCPESSHMASRREKGCAVQCTYTRAEKDRKEK